MSSLLSSLVAFSRDRPSIRYGVLLVAYMTLVRHLRYRRINALLKKYPDPTLPLRDIKVAREVATATQAYEFPYLNVVSLEFALFKTYAIPTISKILAGSRQFASQCAKRADDTGLILAEMNESTKRQEYRALTQKQVDPEDAIMDQKRERVALEKLNFIHGHYPIRQEDYLFTLALFVLEPDSWIGRFEWRSLTMLEKNVSHLGGAGEVEEEEEERDGNVRREGSTIINKLAPDVLKFPLTIGRNCLHSAYMKFLFIILVIDNGLSVRFAY